MAMTSSLAGLGKPALSGRGFVRQNSTMRSEAASFRRGLLCGVAAFALVFHVFCFSLCWWNDCQLEREGISIESILSGGKR